MAEPTVHPAVDAVSRVMDHYDQQVANNPAWAAEAADEVAAVRNAIDRCRGAVARAVRVALLSQPTPSAEKPRIEDMAPGTTFTASEVCGDEHQFAITASGRILPSLFWTVDSHNIDLSTIRDVTPPEVTQ